jgi:hypothetical protein
MGKTPVVWSTGRSLVLIWRVVPVTVTEYEAVGQLTDPWTATLASEFHVWLLVLIHGGVVLGGAGGKVVVHESTYPFLGWLDT